jgi:CheY-like chemotaxis protein
MNSNSAPLILCIDDHVGGLQIRRMLLERSGYSVLTALTATEGLDKLKPAAVDLVITDYFLPDMDGATLAGTIKSLRPDVPIIMLTGSVEEPQAAVAETVDVFLTKGGPTNELLNEIARLLPPGRTTD